MPFRYRQLICAAFALIAPVLMSNCGEVHRVNVTPTTAKEEVSVQPQKSVANELAAFRLVEVKKVADFKLFTDTGKVLDAARLLAGAERSVRVATARRGAIRPPVATTGSLDSVVACIYAHESGNYAESSHPGSGSGAAQWIPSTWRAWSARAGYPGYDLAYQAPPSVQEAVLRYTLTHGGAGNWSVRFGPDPCTGN